MSTDAAPAAGRSKLPFVIGGLVALVVVLAVVWFAGKAWADGRAEDYAKDFAAWQKGQGAELVSSTSALPTGTYLLKDVTTTKALATQRTGCAAVERIAKDAKAAGEGVPTVSAGVGGLFSGSLRDAASDSDDRAEAVEAYAKKASAVFEQVHADCAWNVDFNTPSKENKQASALYEKSEKYLDKRGPTGPGAQCNHDTCIAYKKSDRVKYASIVSQAYDLNWRSAKKRYSEGCADTSYGPQMCKAFVTATDRYRATRQNFATVVRKATNSVDNPVFDRASAEWDKVEKGNAALLASTVKKSLPALAKDKKLAANPGFTDRFFVLASRSLLASLADDREKVADL